MTPTSPHLEVGWEGVLTKKSVMFADPIISTLLPVLFIAEGGNKGSWFLLFKKTHWESFLDFPEADLSAKGETKRSKKITDFGF